jgi:hypothetical protein
LPFAAGRTLCALARRRRHERLHEVELAVLGAHRRDRRALELEPTDAHAAPGQVDRGAAHVERRQAQRRRLRALEQQREVAQRERLGADLDRRLRRPCRG